MATVTIYHNPRCSKSRQTLVLLQEQGHHVEIIEYLKTPPDAEAIRILGRKLELDPIDMIRAKEHRDLGLVETADADELVRRMAEHPTIIQRPIVVHGDVARIGRPPEKVLEIL